jgi:membrane complex biogenesis BtpA family protein
LTSRFRAVFPNTEKTLIAMVHLPALPGTPLYDAERGIPGAIDWVKRDLQILLPAGFDAVMFCNENDRPYRLNAGLETAAVMSRIVAELVSFDLPFGVDVLWDPACALAVSIATGARFMREVATGVWESDMGLWTPDAAGLLRERRRLDGDDLAVLMNVTPEFASSIGRRSPAEIARSVVVSSLADGILVSGAMAGLEPDLSVLSAVREAVPDDVPVLLNTGAKAGMVRDFLQVADGCIVGSDLKTDGHTWNPVDRERVARFIDAARSA